MNAIQLTAVDFTLSQGVRAHVDAKFTRLDRYLPDLERCSLIIHPLPTHGYRVDVQLHRNRGSLLALHATGTSVYGALNLAAESARSRCRRLHRRQGSYVTA